MKDIFLESHNIKNPYTGLGQFNLNLLLGLNKAATGTSLRFHYYSMNNSFKENLDPKRFLDNKYYSFSKFPLLRNKKKYDVWHSLNQNTKIEPYHSIPYVLTIHDINFYKKLDKSRLNNFKKKIERATAITYISNFVKQDAHQVFSIPQVPEYVIHNGNSICRSHTNIPAYQTDKPYLFSIGDFLERKNFHILIAMLQYLPDFQLIIAGNHDRKYGQTVLQEITKNNLEKRVILTGKISNHQKIALYKGCSAFVTAGENEGFCLPVIEAMNFGKPTFLYRNAALPEIGDRFAYYWDQLEPEYMASILLEGLSHNPNNMSEEEIKNHAKKFNWEKSALDYLHVYQETLNS